jgi:toxin-antitoxin system PIN domain toxin
MLLFDVNILMYATRTEATDHERYRDWLISVVEAPAAFGVSEIVLSSFLRIITNPKILVHPFALSDALEVTARIRARPNCVLVHPGPRHWEIFVDLCRKVSAKANLVADAYLAALAIESGSDWFSTDRDFARFPGLRWRHPLDD